MNRPTKIVLLIAGAIYMLNFFGCAGDSKYEVYSSKNSELNFTIDYIKGWDHREQIGSLKSFIQAVFYEPAIKDKKILAMIAVTVEDGSKVNFTPKNIDGMLSDLIKKRMLFDSAKILSKARKNVCGAEAFEIEFSYKTLDSFENIKAKLAPTKERVVIFERSGKFYTVRYTNLADNFDMYSNAFKHIVKSIKFKNN